MVVTPEETVLEVGDPKVLVSDYISFDDGK